MFLFSLFSLALADIPAGSTIEAAGLIDVPPEGFSSISTMLPALVPQNIPVSPSTGGGSALGCDYDYGVEDIWVDVNVASAEIVPQNGFLSLDIGLQIAINNITDRFALDFAVSNCWLGTQSTCSGYVTTFPAILQARINLNLIDPDGDGINELDASITDVSIDYSAATANNFRIECLVGSILDALSWIGVDVYSFVLDLIKPILENEINNQLPELETTIEEAFANASIDQEVALGENMMKIVLSPNDLNIVPDGLRLSFDGMTAIQDAATCIQDYDAGASLETPGVANAIGDLAVPADVGIAIRDEFVNQALYSVWRAGMLCQTIDENTFALDSSILQLLSGDAFTEIVPETKPMTITIDPVLPPTLDMNVDSDVGISIEDLRLNFVTEVDEREVQILSVSLETIAGLNLLFDPNTGALEGDVALNPEEIATSIVHNEFVPEADQMITDSFGTQFGSLLDLVGLDSLLSSLNFQLPSVNGVGVTQVEIAGTGSNSSDLGSHLFIGPVPYSGGCSSTSSTGCSTTETPHNQGKTVLLFMVGVLGYLRRRAK